MSIILLLCLTILTSGLNAELKDVFQNCCDIGTHHVNITCSPNDVDLYSMLNYSTRYLAECKISFQLCCSKAKSELACKKGKMIALNHNHCDYKWNDFEITRLSSNPTFGCCQACKLGLIAKKQAKSCRHEAKLGHLEDQIFHECCSHIKNSDNISSIIDVAEISDKPFSVVNEENKVNYLNLLCKGSNCEECLDDHFDALCRCRYGFEPNFDNRFCVDKDECQDANICKSEEDCLNIIGSYYCAPKFPDAKWCPNGYMKRFGQCIDIDECKEGLVVCRESFEICVNLNGSYACEAVLGTKSNCNIGYEWEIDSCQDIDECETGEHNCDVFKEKCINLPGSFICSLNVNSEECPKGYKFNKITKVCEDVDECKTANICSEIGTCINYVGSYRCSCPTGYEVDPIRGCVDINECELDLDNCPETHRCDNRLGSFACVRSSNCGTGYIYNQDTDTCEDTNECENQLHPCGSSFRCINIPGSFKCKRIECPAGQILLSDETCRSSNCGPGLVFSTLLEKCVDIDECLSNPCSSHYTCENQFGSYRCKLRDGCELGLELSSLDNECIDIDECKIGTHQCDSGLICKNTFKSYECECPSGFRINSLRKCEDIDECKHSENELCSYSSTCVNTPGSYRCECKPGFKKSEIDDECIDINECEEKSALCSHECYNIFGSYICTCPIGYELKKDNNTCVDINECEIFNKTDDTPLCIFKCENTPGHYICICPVGYRSLPDGGCKDINECQEDKPCGDENICVNTLGKFKCHVFECPVGYIKDRDHTHRCRRPDLTLSCSSDSECEKMLKNPLFYSYSYLALPSNVRLPENGHLSLLTIRSTRLPHVTVLFNLKSVLITAEPGIEKANETDFTIEKSNFNEAVISLVHPLKGPQDIQIEVDVNMYSANLSSGFSKALLYLHISEYEF